MVIAIGSADPPVAAAVRVLQHSDVAERRWSALQQPGRPRTGSGSWLHQRRLHRADVQLDLLPLVRLRVYASGRDRGRGSYGGSTAVPAAAVDIARLFSEIDKFMAQVLAVPAAANDPTVKRKLELLETSKEQYRAAHADDLARRAAALGQISAFQQKHKEQKEAALKKGEERNAPPQPVDGDALHDAMLKNLGLKY